MERVGVPASKLNVAVVGGIGGGVGVISGVGVGVGVATGVGVIKGVDVVTGVGVGPLTGVFVVVGVLKVEAGVGDGLIVGEEVEPDGVKEGVPDEPGELVTPGLGVAVA